MGQDIEAAVERELVTKLHHLNRWTYIGTAAVAFIALAAIWRHVPGWAAIGFGGVQIAVLAARARLFARFRRLDRDRAPLERWARAFTATTAIFGVSWAGLLLAMPFETTPLFATLLVFCAMVGLMAGGMGAYPVHMPTFYALFLPLMAGMAVKFALAPSPFGLPLATMIIIAGGLMAGHARMIHRTLAGNIRLSLEKSELIGELRQASAEARAADLAKTEFLSVMSHELRSPLNAVIGNAGLLLDTELDGAQHGYALDAQRAGEHLLHLVNDILDYTRLDSDRLELDIAPFDLDAELDMTLGMVSPEARAKGLVLELAADPGLAPRYEGDAGRLRQVLINLLGNAVKFTEAGTVRLEAAETGRTAAGTPELTFRVRDSGIGIPEDLRPRLFREFVQGDGSATRRHGGTGLGLVICQRLLSLMGGRIALIDSVPAPAPGHGSVFEVTLPLPRAPAPRTADSIPTGAGERAGGEGKGEGETKTEFETGRALRVLVAEDNRANQMLIKAILEKMGHSVTLVANGLEAVAAIEAGPPAAAAGGVAPPDTPRDVPRDTPACGRGGFDLVLMDIHMPEMDGLTAARRIRAGMAGAEARTGTKARAGAGAGHLPIIALTADGRDETRRQTLEAGMDAHLVKPVATAALTRLLARYGARDAPVIAG